jgi:hypothetical protein
MTTATARGRGGAPAGPPAPPRRRDLGLSRLVRWVGGLLRRPIARLRRLWSAAKHLGAPLRWLFGGQERGFGFWWLVATLAIAVALGMVVALLLTPVAGLIALLVVAVWALVRRARRPRDDGDPGETRSPAEPIPT